MDPETGELEAPLGTVQNLARGVLALATAFGGRSVASVDFPTRDPALPMTIAAREGEPLVVAAGDSRCELPPEAVGWAPPGAASRSPRGRPSVRSSPPAPAWPRSAASSTSCP